MMSPAADSQPCGELNPTPVDGGTLLPPSSPPEGVHCTLQGLSSTDSSLIADTSHVQQLINHGADVDAPDNKGWTPLHTAAYHGQEEIVRILLAANADVNARSKNEETPLHLAAKWPQDRVVEALLSGGADLSARSKRGRTPAHIAALFNRHAILDRLLNAGADVNALDAEQQTPLHLAVRANCPVEPELVKTLIRHNANLEQIDVRGHTPLHFLPSAQVGDWLHWAAYEGREPLMQVLLAKPGVRPDCYSEEGLTPLHLAAHVNSTNMVTMLLNAGAKVNAPSQPPAKTSGKDSSMYGIPLPGAPGSITAGISISSQLKAYGSSKLPPGELTALHIAAERGSAELIRVLVGAGAKVNIQGERGMPPLHVAVWEGNTAAVVSLLAAKASVSLKSKAGGFTSVHCACLSSRATPELLALLLDNGGAAVIEERCQEGWTALHLACQSAPPAMVELLLARGARPTAKGKNGRTAADCAAKRPEILQLLHVYTGGKVPLPYGVGLPSMAAAAAAAAANGLLAPNGGSSAAGGGGSRGARTAAGGGGGRGSAASAPLPCSQQPGLLPGTAAMLEPLESVEATLAALLADMGGALCSLQAGAVFGAGACSVDPVGHCIRPLDKRLVMMCTLGCQFSFHLQCWKSAREVLKERWPNFNGSLAAEGRYCCFAPGCPGYIREQAICDGAQMQSSSQSRLYLMPQEVYDTLPQQAKPIGGGVPPQPGGSDGYGGIGNGQQHSGPLQPPLPAGGGGCSGGGGGLSSLAALGPSLTLAQAMVQAATAMGNIVGGSTRLGASQLAALVATGSLPALLAGNGPPVPQAMSAREAAAIAAQTLGVTFGGSGGAAGSSSSCVVEELGSGDDFDEEPDGGATAPPSTSASGRSGNGTRGSVAAIANGGGSSGPRKQGVGCGGGGGSSARRGTKAGGSGGGKSLGSKSAASSPISSAAAAEMLQQLQGLQQAVAAVQSAVGAGVHSMGLGMGGGASPAGGAATDGATCHTAGAAAPSAAAGKGPCPPGLSGGDQQQGQQGGQKQQQQLTVLEPPREVLLPPRELPPAGPSSSSGDDGDGCGDLGGGGSVDVQEVAPVPPPRRRNQPMPPMSRRASQPLTGVPYEHGRQLLSPQLATPPPATSLLTPGVQTLLSAPAAASSAGSAAVPTPLTPLCQRSATLAPILVGPLPPSVPQQHGSCVAAAAVTPAALIAPTKSSPVPTAAAHGASAGPRHASANGCATVAAMAAGSDDVAGSSCGGSGTRSSPVRSAGGAAGGGTQSGATTAAAVAAAAGPAVPPTKLEQKPSPSCNGPPTYGARVNLSAASLSIGYLRNSSSAPSVAAAASGRSGAAASGNVSVGQSPPGLTITRASGGKCSAAVAHGPSSALHQGVGSYEPGGYARAVCPSLRPGVHRVTLSADRSVSLQQQQPQQPQPEPQELSAAPAQEGPNGAGADAEAEASPSRIAGEVTNAACAAADSGLCGMAASEKSAIGGAVGPVAAAADGIAIVVELGTIQEAREGKLQAGGDEAGGATAFREPQPTTLQPPPVGDTAEGLAAAASEQALELAAVAGTSGLHDQSPPVTESAAPTAATAAGLAASLESDIVLAVLHSLRQVAVSCSERPAAATRTLPASATAATSGADPARPPSSPEPAAATGRHLLLESCDVPLLAGTPGMLEAWLSAHVGAHGRLAAYRILAPQGAVALSLESESAATAAASSLRRRSQMLVAPLAVAPLVEFPDDEVLAGRALQVARASCPPGDRSWTRRMVELWEQLHTLPPPVVRD